MSKTNNEIAIIGMSLRVPGADNLTQFWNNLRNGVESITFFSDTELRAAGVNEATLTHPDYVKALGRLADIELFDAEFFALTPREAEILDPQHRLLLEGVWRALEHAGIDSERYAGRIGLFAGIGLNGYLLHNLINHPELLETVGGWQLNLSNDKDFATTRIAYKLNLQGPAITINTACSTSLVATVLAAQSLLSHQCDVIVVGGCSLHLPQDQGYFYVKSGIMSPDGHCRPFDRAAAGTLDGNGVALVVLKRLNDALAEGDSIYGVLRGFAINNDGSLKVAYSAPSVAGQAEVIIEALEIAGLSSDALDYIETHGTATELGDAVEIKALAEAFRATSANQRINNCAIGAVKSNIGHLDTAAGAVGLIKTLLAMNAGEIPPTCHFQAPNPKLELNTTPFFVNNKLIPWQRRAAAPRRAGVSSFGIGGTNAHVIIEEAPVLPAAKLSSPWVLLPLAAHNENAVEAIAKTLAEHIDSHPEQSLADIAYTLQLGRRHFAVRRVLVVASDDRGQACAQLRTANGGWRGTATSNTINPIFLLPGQDAHYLNMALSLYREEPHFRATLEQCQKLLITKHGIDLLSLLYPDGLSVTKPRFEQNTASIDPLPLYVVTYALAQLWLAWGITPRALVGYSLGEYVAATLSSVISLEDGLKLAVASRDLLRQLKPGRMIAISLPVAEVKAHLITDSYLAMVTAPNQVIVAGTELAIAQLTEQLNNNKILWRTVPLSLPFHTPLMTPFLAPFNKILAEIRFNPPHIPYFCSLTGEWISASIATDPNHYLRLATNTVRLDLIFERLFKELTAIGDAILLEVGPNQTMSSFALQHPQRPASLQVLASLPDPRTRSMDEFAYLLSTAGRLWLAGAPLAWSELADSERRRVALPGYPLKPQRFWIEPARHSKQETLNPLDTNVIAKESDKGRWGYLPGWRRLAPSSAKVAAGSRWLIIADAAGLTEKLAAALRSAAAEVVIIYPRAPSDTANLLAGTMEAGFVLDVNNIDAWGALFNALGAWHPQQIVHCAFYQWTTSINNLPFTNLLTISYAFGRHYFSDEITLNLIADRLLAVESVNLPDPAKTTAIGPLLVMAQEYSNFTTRTIDLDTQPQLAILIAELADINAPKNVALRNSVRWREYFEPITLPKPLQTAPIRLRHNGVYLITGGLGNIGLTLALYLAETLTAKLVLISRATLPPRDQWLAYLNNVETPPRLMNQLRRLLAIEAVGGEVLLCSADVADQKAMAAVFATATDRFGTIHGIIHAAGLVGKASSLIAINDSFDQTGINANQQQFISKVNGAEVLAALLDKREFDFCLICSSLSSLLGGIGFAAYAATNLYVDALITQLNHRQPARWLAVNWDGWRFEFDDNNYSNIENSLGLEMSPAEGREIFIRLMALTGWERLIISSGDLQLRLKKWVERQPNINEVSLKNFHHRPELHNQYIAPRTPTEQKLAIIWEQLLGINGVGVEDNFIELGGNSLSITQLIALTRRTFQIEVSLNFVFEHPTIAEIAGLIEQNNNSASSERDEGLL